MVVLKFMQMRPRSYAYNFMVYQIFFSTHNLLNSVGLNHQSNQSVNPAKANSSKQYKGEDMELTRRQI